MRLDVGAIDHVRLMVGVARKLLQDSLEHSAAVPAREPRVDRLPWAKPRRKIPPWDARLRDEEDCVHEDAVR
jgi:hypothetical protein